MPQQKSVKIRFDDKNLTQNKTYICSKLRKAIIVQGKYFLLKFFLFFQDFSNLELMNIISIYRHEIP